MKLLHALLVLCPCIAVARIGETPDECAKRYGAARSQDKAGSEVIMSAHFRGGISIRCSYTDGKCDTIFFDMTPPSVVDLDRRDFTAAESAKLLDANGGGSPWEMVAVGVFQTADKGRRAAVSGSLVVIETTAGIERRRAIRNSAEVAKVIEGF